MNTISSSLLPTTEPVAEFPAWVTSTPMPPSPLILEIGAGTGMFDYPENIRGKLGAIKLVGVDPDIAILTNSFLDERHVATAEQFAAQDTRQFDCIYSMFVVEHVSSPRAFMAACHKLLKPHGSFFAMTCNYWHYFGFLATISEQLGVQDNLLARLRGKQLTESCNAPLD